MVMISQENKRFELMHKDKVIAHLDMTNGSVQIREKNFLPMELCFIEDNPTIEERVGNISAFKEWCASRTLMMNQKHAKKICNALNLSQDNSIENKAQIALAYHCSTLQDCYWVRKEGVDLSYNDVSLFRNTSRNILTPVSLRGEIDSVFTKKLKNWSDLGADGTLAKSWIREDGNYHLYKAGDNIFGELLASNILQTIKAKSVAYQVDSNEGLEVSKCQCFTNEDISFVPYRVIAKVMGINAINYVKENFPTDYANLAIACYLTGNEDLHDKNWGFSVDNNTGNIIGLSPLFDFDGCFLYYEKSKNLKFLPECVFVMENGNTSSYYSWDLEEEYEVIGPTIEEAAIAEASRCTFNFDSIDLQLIPQEFREEFKRRVDNIEKNRNIIKDEIYKE